MKKLILIGIAVLMAAAIVSCVFEAPKDAALEKPVLVYDDNGNAIGVELGVKIVETPGKALTKPLAQAGVNYYEVVFAYDIDGTGVATEVEQFIRRSWRSGGQVRVTVPFGNYNNADVTGLPGQYKAYLFAGRYDTKTLLAVGVITAVTDSATPTVPTPGAIISASTISVTFTLTALQTDIGGLATPPLYTVPVGDPAPTLTALQNSVPVNIITNRVRIDDNPVPIAMFARTLPVTATYTIYGIDMSTGEAHEKSIVVNGAPALNSTGFIYGEGDIPLGKLVLQTNPPSLTAPNFSDFLNNNTGTSSTPVVFNPAIQMRLVPPDKDGLGIFYFQIPVMMYSITHNPLNEPAPVQWYIRGGINNEIIDAGAAHNFGDGSIGGAVLYGVGNVLDGAGFIVIPSFP